jgi:hypothetical protein
MPCYTFHVGDAATVIEMTDVDLEDNDTAREYAITFVAELFRSRHQDFPDWESCNIQVLGADQSYVVWLRYRSGVPALANLAAFPDAFFDCVDEIAQTPAHDVKFLIVQAADLVGLFRGAIAGLFRGAVLVERCARR